MQSGVGIIAESATTFSTIHLLLQQEEEKQADNNHAQHEDQQQILFQTSNQTNIYTIKWMIKAYLLLIAIQQEEEQSTEQIETEKRKLTQQHTEQVSETTMVYKLSGYIVNSHAFCSLLGVHLA